MKRMNPFQALVSRLFSSRPVTITTRSTSGRLRYEQLEDRTVPASFGFRSIDGSGNNLTNLTWGTAGTDFLRIAQADYADGVSTPAGTTRPSAREISNSLSDQTGVTGTNDRMMSAMVYAWGQFIDHDMDLSKTGTGQRFDIAVPTGDPSFDPASTGTKVIPLTRTFYDTATGTSVANPRQQVNSVTSWIDGSMVYGSDATTAASLRTFQGGKMKTSPGDMLPMDASGNFMAGDARVNENPELTSLQTLFVREHNRVAERIAKANPALSDEQVYQRAKEWVTAEIQAITYNEWLPALTGQNLPRYQGYNATVNGGISNEFATAGFRFGHSLLADDIQFLDNNGKSIADGVSLAEAFNNPGLVKAHGVESLIKYLASDPSNEVDTHVVDSVRNFLFGAPGAGGLDLASLNIQRGRDHGLADYNATRVAFGLPKVTSFAQITSNVDTQAKLQALYGSVNNIDLWVGALAEDHIRGGSVGMTVKAIMNDQFSRLREGDRFWYQREFAGNDLRELESTTLSSLIRRNSTTSNMQNNVFFFRADISGRVAIDGHRDGRLDRLDPPAVGVQVQLWDLTTSLVLATVTTDARGFYHFGVADDVRTGDYQVRLVNQAVPPSRTLSITRGDMNYDKVDFLLPPPGRPKGPPAGLTVAPPASNPGFMAADFFTLNGVDVNLQPVRRR